MRSHDKIQRERLPDEQSAGAMNRYTNWQLPHDYSVFLFSTILSASQGHSVLLTSAALSFHTFAPPVSRLLQLGKAG